MNFGQQNAGFNEKPRPAGSGKGKFLRNVIIGGIIVVIALALFSSCWYTVNDKQQAVITTFGKITGTSDAGIHLKFPLGVQQVHLVDVNVHQKIEIGYTTNKDGSTTSNPNESKMITGDFNIVNVDFFVEYKVSNPEKYLYYSADPEGILKSLVQSQIRTVIGSYKVDDILTTKKGEIQAKVKESIISELEKYDFGLQLIDVKIQDAEAPTLEVIEAFKSVETAKQDKETALNDAKAYENKNIPSAQAQEDQLIQNAEYLKQNRINDAKKQVSMFNAMYSQYILNPGITKQRMYYEAIDGILPGVKVFINTSKDGSTEMLLPLDTFSGAAK
ncbi:MAG: FtsH protease activity modulator HflK [Eubacteriales bacterium]